MSPFRPPSEFETHGLRLRRFEPTDAVQLFHALLGDPRVTEWLTIPTHRSVEESAAYIEVSIRCWEKGYTFIWGAFGKNDGRLCALIELSPKLPRVEFGLLTSQQPGHVRRRDVLRAVRTVIDWAMDQSQVGLLYACCAPEGKAASAMSKLGFTFEARLVNWEERPNQPRTCGDSLIFCKTNPPYALRAPRTK